MSGPPAVDVYIAHFAHQDKPARTAKVKKGAAPRGRRGAVLFSQRRGQIGFAHMWKERMEKLPSRPSGLEVKLAAKEDWPYRLRRKKKLREP